RVVERQGKAARVSRAATPSPSLPTRGRVSSGASGRIVPRAQSGTSHLVGEDGRGDALGTMLEGAINCLTKTRLPRQHRVPAWLAWAASFLPCRPPPSGSPERAWY